MDNKRLIKDIGFQMILIIVGMIIGAFITRFIWNEDYARYQTARELYEMKRFCPYCGELLDK